MKLTALSIIAFGAFALVTAGSATASDPSAAPSHADLAHQNADRQQTYQTARSLGLSHSQTDRLKSNLQHQARDDQRAHRSATNNAPTYGTATPSYNFNGAAHGARAKQYRAQSRLRHGYSSQGFRTVAPSHRNSSWNYGYSRPAYNNHGVRISTPGFSLQLGH